MLPTTFSVHLAKLFQRRFLEIEIWWETPMEGSVLSFLKAEWKVSDTTHAVLVIGLYELLDPTTILIEPSGPLQKTNKKARNKKLYV
jgi:hypothetical protein